MKIELFDLVFNIDHFYVQQSTIVEKISFNNRTFYSKYEKMNTPLSSLLLMQHQNNETTLAVPLISHDHCNYIVIEYYQEDWESFYSLLKHLLKTFSIEEYFSYRNPKKMLFQLYIPTANDSLEVTYSQVEQIKNLMELKSKKGYKIFPNQNLPKNFNIITLPQQKI